MEPNTNLDKEQKKWEVTTNRFVAFFDIMGFKDLVERNSHSEVVSKLQLLKTTLKALEIANSKDSLKQYDVGETKSITFSDSIVIFSESNTEKDANKILLDSGFLINKALEYKIGIKGAISYGEVTVDFENSLFFGRPIIDAYLLHDQLHMYSAVLDHHFEKIIQTFTLHEFFQKSFISYNACLKTGKVHHKLVCPPLSKYVESQIENCKALYNTVSGSPRIYIDNTIDFLNYALQQKEATPKK